MSYTALYRKFRPSTFEDVKGQDHIVTTLKNQIRADRIGHAYLFCGTRGTGKTTIAKILARSVNCEHPVDGSPCNECPTCKAILAGVSTNVIEIDAASNNGVDNIREIREEVAYRPTQGRYKVYIIDEVHMLSTGAFNALLKTLEEPPSYVIFILATTEANKIPVTILSRCQRYDFRRITIDTIAARLSELMEKEGVDVEEKAIRYVAKAGDGSMRDALSLLDQCIAFYLGQKLTYDKVLEVLGTVDTEIFSQMLRTILAGDVTGSIRTLETLLNRGKELGQFVTDFTWYLRNLLLVKSADETEELLDVSTENLKLLKEESNGTMELKVFANSALGNKSKLIDQMVMGENVITIADGAFYADYGVPDLGILYGPFFFDNWDEVWKLIDSDWYKDQCSKLADKGLTVLGSNWIYGERELMTKDKVVVPADIKGKKIRLANSQIYVEGFNALGATAVPMALGDVYTALQNGTLDGVENPLSTLYGQSFQEVTKNILMTGHILNFTTWCIGTDYLNTLTQEQQDLLFKTCEEAGLYNNEKQEAANVDYRKKLEDAGVTFTELTDEERAQWKEASLSFYEKGSQFGWSDGLYDTVKAAIQ